QPQHLRDLRPAIDQVAQKDRLPAGWRRHAVLEPACRIRFVDAVSQDAEQLGQFVVAAMHVADDVKRPVLVLAVVPQRRALDDGRIDLLGRFEYEYVAEALLAQKAEPAPHRAMLIANPLAPHVVAILA